MTEPIKPRMPTRTQLPLVVIWLVCAGVVLFVALLMFVLLGMELPSGA